MCRCAAPSCGSRRSAMFKPARILMREISACGKHVGRRRRDLQQSIDAHPQHQPGAKRLDMDVGCAQLDRFLQQIIDGTHDGCTAGKIAKAVDIVVGLGRIGLVAFWSGDECHPRRAAPPARSRYPQTTQRQARPDCRGRALQHARWLRRWDRRRPKCWAPPSSSWHGKTAISRRKR